MYFHNVNNNIIIIINDKEHAYAKEMYYTSNI